MNKYPLGASVPPKVGEYGYFLTNMFTRYYKVGILKDTELIVPCHYSLKQYIPNNILYTVSWGKITFVKNE